jgi:hypothetical protein
MSVLPRPATRWVETCQRMQGLSVYTLFTKPGQLRIGVRSLEVLSRVGISGSAVSHGHDLPFAIPLRAIFVPVRKPLGIKPPAGTAWLSATTAVHFGHLQARFEPVVVPAGAGP